MSGFDKTLKGKADKKLSSDAVNKIGEMEAAGLDKKNAGAMRTLVYKSDFSAVYSEFLLSENPTEYRSSLPHNQQFRKDAEDCSINLGVYFSGVPDNGVEIPIGEVKAKGGIDLCNPILNQDIMTQYRKLIDVRDAFNKEVKEIYDKLADTSTIKSIYERLLPKYKTSGIEMDGDVLDAVGDETCIYSARTERLYDAVFEVKQAIDEFAYALPESRALFLQDEDQNDVEGLTKDDRKLIRRRLKEAEYEQRVYRLSQLPGQIRQIIHRAKNLMHDNAVNFDAAKSGVNMKRFKKHDTIRYFVKREVLSPHDVLIGNDGGCCIGIYGEDIEDASGLPFMMLDEGTAFFGVYQQLGDKPPVRSGMVLSFVASDEELRPILVANSIELSRMKNPGHNEVIDPLVDHINQYLIDFSKAAGFQGYAMGSHSYNTSMGYGTKNFVKPSPKEELLKLPDIEHPNVYQEVFVLEKDQFIAQGGRNYVWLIRPEKSGQK